MKYLRLAHPTLITTLLGVGVLGGAGVVTHAQQQPQGRDPFLISPAARSKAKATGGTRPAAVKPAAPTVVTPPALQGQLPATQSPRIAGWRGCAETDDRTVD